MATLIRRWQVPVDPERRAETPDAGAVMAVADLGLRPRTEAELSEAIVAADGPLRISGGSTRPVGRPVAGTLLDTGGLAGVRLHEPGALTLVAGAGTAVAEIEAVLAQEGQRLPFEPMDHRRLMGTAGAPTLGGMVAANASGPARVVRGACRDSLIGVRFVDGTGTVVANGGRVMKNVTGYDLVKLMAGSWGTLGVLSEVAFKLLPQPEAHAALICRGLDDARAVAALTAALATPYEVTGAAHRTAAEGAETVLRIEGFAGSVAHRGDKLRGALAPFGAFEIDTDPARVAALWADIRDVAAFAGQAGDVWLLALRPTEAPDIVARAAATVPGLAAQYDWGGGRVWVLVPEGTDLRAALGSVEGHATLVRASAETRTRLRPFPPEPTGVARLAAGLRARFDPRGILNAGLMD